ncbi:TPA: hypothetical protein EYP44_00250, partial [Candidatus Bathyarchaeota archaeon]|nr:hypothetical protein [Candidatus Bathyarchaeota archaeon]
AVEEFGPLVTDYARPDFAQPRAYKARIVGQVLHIDDFGNVITNIDDRSVDRLVGIGGVLRVALGRKALTLRRCKTYADVPAGSPLALIGSAGYLEIAVNQGNAAKAFGVEVGDPVQIRLPRLH